MDFFSKQLQPVHRGHEQIPQQCGIGLGMWPVVEHLQSIQKALSLIPNIAKTENKTK